MTSVLTKRITENCDRLFQESDRIAESAAWIDSEVGRLGTSANYATVQITLLRDEQTKLAGKLKHLSWRLFWSNLRPSFILARLRREF